MIQVYREKDYESLSRRAANIISAQVILKPASVLGLATGSTPEGIYRQLVSWYQKNDLSFRQVRTVNLDEYVGMSAQDDNSYRYYMNHHLFSHINIDLQNTRVPNGLATDLQAECTDYDANIRALGGIDLQLLGLGGNGHIGFNEPATAFTKSTHVVDLCESTIEANARFFASAADVPRQALTMGIGSIMKARHVLLVASGDAKANALYRTFCEPVSAQMPGSILQFHPNVTVIADEAALRELDAAGVSIGEG